MAHANSDISVIAENSAPEAQAAPRTMTSRFAPPDIEDARLTRRARRQALGLMILSGLVSVAVIFALWLGFHAVL